MNTTARKVLFPCRPIALGLALALGTMTLGAGCANFSHGVGGSTEPVQDTLIKDTLITTTVRTALATVEGVDSRDIGVETNMGVVTITGQVDTQATLNRIIDATRLVSGVERVDTSRVTIGGG